MITRNSKISGKAPEHMRKKSEKKRRGMFAHLAKHKKRGEKEGNKKRACPDRRPVRVGNIALSIKEEKKKKKENGSQHFNHTVEKAEHDQRRRQQKKSRT